MNTKRTIYLIASSFFGFLLSLLAHAGIEAYYLRTLMEKGTQPHWNFFLGASCALPAWLIILLPIAGIALGLWIGTVWWRIVYVEKRHWIFWKRR